MNDKTRPGLPLNLEGNPAPKSSRAALTEQINLLVAELARLRAQIEMMHMILRTAPNVRAGTSPNDSRRWRIWSIEHNSWWRKNSFGYTNLLPESGFYSTAEALEICVGGNRFTKDIPNEAMIPLGLAS